MKRLLNYTIILSLSLVVFGCGGPTIEYGSDEFNHLDETKNGIVTYDGKPFTGTITRTHKNGQLDVKTTYKDGSMNGSYEKYYENGQLEVETTYRNGEEIE